ncbi:Frataxin [Hypoxylon sp. FL1284]|nr:Frataxin [Hypoxylon sp. FL1284]
MMLANVVKRGRNAFRANISAINSRAIIPRLGSRATRSVLKHPALRRPSSVRPFSVTSRPGYPLAPEALAAAVPAPITADEYHEIADNYLEALLTKYEELQDESDSVDVDFSSGVMTIKIPGLGVYVINKQPPNKQIWLSSPVSGPKRFDYVVVGEGQDQKQDTASGDWVYLRDGTILGNLLKEETGVAVDF